MSEHRLRLPGTLRTAELARLMGVAPRVVTRWWHAGRLPEPFDMDDRGANCRWLTRDVAALLPGEVEIEAEGVGV